MSTTLKKCREGRTHFDGLALVEYLVNKGGSARQTNEAIAIDLGMMKSLGGGMRKVDMPRFVQARDHVKDGINAAGQPCIGYRLHYRSSAKGTEFALIDPSGGIGSHLIAAVETAQGWIGRERQHKTENLRQVETWNELAEHAYANSDKAGYRVCVAAAVELEREGTVSASTMADVAVWLDALRAKAKP